MNFMGNLQQLGRAVMLPMIILPAAAICLSLSALPWDLIGLPSLAVYLSVAGHSLFLFLPYLFAAGVAWGTSTNGGASALSAAWGHVHIYGHRSIQPL